MASTAQPAYYGSVLREGVEGPDVALVQVWLNAARTRYPELPRLTVDGKFGPATTAAVRAFQRLVGITSDGAVGLETWDALYGTYSAMRGVGEVWPGITMREGMAGATVRSAQLLLKMLVPSLTADGVYGLHTRNAVFAYQVVHDLMPDGVLGRDTWMNLYG